MAPHPDRNGANPVAEIAAEADFSIIRYAQCWEDADVVLEALDIRPGDSCVSIASAGDNTLSILSKDPGRVVAVDLSPAQMVCLEARVAAYQELDHGELLGFLGARPCDRRPELYARLRHRLSDRARAIWDSRPEAIAAGLGSAGKFERYLGLFRKCVLPLIHSRNRIEQLFARRDPRGRRKFFDEEWNTGRWRFLTRLFCSRLVAGRIGRDPRFFRYVEGGVADRVLSMAEHGLVDLDPCDNPYLQWIAYGSYPGPLPHALRSENFEAIRRNLHRLECRVETLESYLAGLDSRSIDRFNLSDVFEYLSEASADRLFTEVARAGRTGGRLAYWNTFVRRRPPAALTVDRLRPLPSLAAHLHNQAKTFFYEAFLVDEVL